MSKELSQKLILIITFIWMVIIFCFSAQPAEESSKTSLKVGQAVGQCIYTDFEKLTPKEQISFARKIEYPVRKIAHLTEYTILGVLIFLSCRWYFNKKKCMVIAWLIGSLYACTDEIHQLFVSGRSCQLLDVGIDSIGCLFGIVCAVLLLGTEFSS